MPAVPEQCSPCCLCREAESGGGHTPRAADSCVALLPPVQNAAPEYTRGEREGGGGELMVNVNRLKYMLPNASELHVPG